MANPVFVDCTKNIWTKVATNITTGLIHKVHGAPYEYRQTYRETGGAAPTLRSDGVSAFENNRTEIISATAGIDIYIYPINVDGKVRVDI